MNIHPELTSSTPEYPQHDIASTLEKLPRLAGISTAEDCLFSTVEDCLSKSERNIMYKIKREGWTAVEMQLIGGEPAPLLSPRKIATAEKRYEKYRRVYEFMIENGIDFPK